MSHQPGRPLPINPVFKQPSNLHVIHDILPADRELLSSSADIRVCKYAICLSEDNLPGLLPEDKDYKVKFFGDIPSLMDIDDPSRPMPFESFVELILSRTGLNVTHQSVNIWATANLTTSAVHIASERQFDYLFADYDGLFHSDPLSYPVLYFFVEFNGPSSMVPSGTNHQRNSPPFLDQRIDPYVAAGGVSPKHVPAHPRGYEPAGYEPTEPTGYEPTGYEPTGYEPTGYEPTGYEPTGYEPTGYEPTGYEPTGYEPTRRHATQPVEKAPNPPPVQPKRAKTFNKLMVAVKNTADTVKELVSPRQAPQQNTVLTELASRIDSEDYLTGLLPKTNGSPQNQAVLSAYQVEQFERYARFFPHVDAKQRGNLRTIRFKHTALAVTPHQFTRAMEILFQDHTSGGLAGGILASDMGTGKSFVILAAVTIRSLVFDNERRVRREWEEVETRERSLKKGSNVRSVKLDHLPRDARRGRGLKCPTQSNRPNDSVCFCVPDGPTRIHLSKLKRGAALIHVPSASMPGWISTLEDANFSRIAYNFQVMYSGPPLSSRLQPGPEFLKGTASNVNKWKMGAVLRDGHPGGMITRTQDLTWFAQPAPLSNRLAMAMETYIVVTSHNSTQLRDLFSWEIRDLSPAPQNCQFPTEGLYAHPFGLTFIDEAHKVLKKDSMPLQMAALSRQILPTPSATTVGDVWLVSGTPFGGQLKDLIEAVSYLAPNREGDGTSLLEAYEAIGPAMTNTPRAMFEMLFNRVFGGELTIRDTWDTTFMGSRITDIQKVRPQYISKETPQSNLHSVRMLMTSRVTAGPRDGYFNTLQKLKPNTQLLYLLSMFPSAAKILLDSPDIPFADYDIRKMIRKEKNTTGESLAATKAFRSIAEKLARSPRSPKLQYLLDELDLMERDRTPRPQASKAGASAHVQDDPTLKKMVIITPTVFTAIMLYIILARNHSRTRPILYHEDLKQSQRSDVLRRFNSLRKRDGPPRVIIAPASVGSEALNLQIANRLILTSPLLDPHQESQALARVNRVGQTLDVQLKILLLEDSPVDRIIVAHRANAQFVNDPFNVAEAIRVVTSDSASTLVP